MGARDDFYMPRGLSKEAAASYLGVKRRTFERIAVDLKPARLGTSHVYDIRDLDALFDLIKAKASGGLGTPEQSVTKFALVSASTLPAAYARPKVRSAEPGDMKWVVKVASTRMPKDGGASTASTGVSAFKDVSTRIRTQRPG